MTACVIMQNMIIEGERDQTPDYQYENEGKKIYIAPVNHIRDEHRLERFLQMHRQVEGHAGYDQLCGDLDEHLWELYGR